MQTMNKPVQYPRKRFPSIHPRRQLGDVIDGKMVIECTELMHLNPIDFFFVGFIPPFVGACLSIVIALIFHNDEISNYNWQCGVRF